MEERIRVNSLFSPRPFDEFLINIMEYSKKDKDMDDDDNNVIVFQGAMEQTEDEPSEIEKLKAEIEEKNAIIVQLNERNASVSSVNELLRIQLMDLINNIHNLQTTLANVMINVKSLQGKLPNTTPEIRFIS